MTVNVQITLDGILRVATPLPALSELCARFLADPASGGWSIVLVDAAGAFAAQTSAEAAARPDGLELRFDSPLNNERLVMVLTVADSVVTATAIEYHGNAGGMVVVRIEGPEAVLDTVGGCIYECGELASLTLRTVEDSPLETVIRFRSGRSATTLACPDTLLFDGYPVPAAEHAYELSIAGLRAVIVSFSQS